MNCPVSCFAITLLVCVGVDAQLKYFTNFDDFQKSLQQVQGLYVKPSDDGSTGDLYVAASEDNGVQTPWIADQSVNFMANPASQVTQMVAAPVPAQTPQAAGDHSLLMSPAALPQPAAPQPMQYAIATMPATASPANNIGYPTALPFPYSFAAMSGTPMIASAVPQQQTQQYIVEAVQGNSGVSNIATLVPAMVQGAGAVSGQPQPQYMQVQFLYPGLYPAAGTKTKEVTPQAEVKPVVTNSVQVPSQPWNAAYAYPQVQYVMVDPSSWAQSQAQTQVQPQGPAAVSQPTDVHVVPVNENKPDQLQ